MDVVLLDQVPAVVASRVGEAVLEIDKDGSVYLTGTGFALALMVFLMVGSAAFCAFWLYLNEPSSSRD